MKFQFLLKARYPTLIRVATSIMKERIYLARQVAKRALHTIDFLSLLTFIIIQGKKILIGL